MGGSHSSTLKGHTNWVWSIAFHPYIPHLVATTGSTGTAQLWTVPGLLHHATFFSMELQRLPAAMSSGTTSTTNVSMPPRGRQFVHFVLLVGEAMCRGYFEADAEDAVSTTAATTTAAIATITITAAANSGGGGGSKGDQCAPLLECPGCRTVRYCSAECKAVYRSSNMGRVHHDRGGCQLVSSWKQKQWSGAGVAQATELVLLRAEAYHLT